ncbi:PREDICTED: anthocyanidin 3-O-glucosyltransferase 2-like [Ipomoea nil]|uniref:anthocyanidin 3-O-glucosyltransferase 2-like n=1 Tax=Ipomoea nil TaxID=35883 RepID=UPI000901E433|nr:PREDICTED: anthocyanidin 3-O-glucosyltransferase 2-like [Ipomoea nil]
MKKVELVFIPAPMVGHIVSIVELAKLLLDRDDRLSITVLVIKQPADPIANTVVQNVVSADARIRHLNLPEMEPPPEEMILKVPEIYLSAYIKSHRSQAKHAIVNNVLSSDSGESPPLAGIVFDFFCSSMVDVANDLGVPSYLFYTSGAGFLGVNHYLVIRESLGGREYTLSDTDSVVSTFASPVPARVMPTFAFNDDGYRSFVEHGKKFRETKGMIINTFAEMEPYAVKALESDPDLPPVYTVGPMLAPQKEHAGKEEIIDWLSEQPPSSVVFLCFGSQGGFEAPQIHQVATALERSGHRFLWSVRRPWSLTSSERASDFTSFDQILPAGFLERTKIRGKVCGWAPQVEVLAHSATAAFVSHCGWNSTLESIWHGVPMVTWPIYAEQQTNAFQLVKELGLAVELTVDYRRAQGSENVVMAEQIEKAIESVMEAENPVRKRAKEMGEKSREALKEGGSSFISLQRLIHDIIHNIKLC